jgi:hypothetical protein
MRDLLRVSILILLTVGVAGCSGDDSDTFDLAPTADLAAAAVVDLSNGDAPPPTALVRIAALSPDKPPLDVCIAPHGSSSFTGPLLKSTGVGSGGLAYGKVSAYLHVPAEPLDYRFVLASVGTCAPSMLGDFTGVQAPIAGQSYTLGIIGFITPPPGNTNVATVRLYTDDAAGNATKVLVRTVHASPDTGGLDVGTGSGASFTAIFSNVTFPNFGTSVTPQSDANGYVSVDPPAAPPTFSARAHGESHDTLVATLPAAPPAGTIATVFVIGDSTGSPQPLKMLVCVDNAPAPNGVSACSTLP